MIELCTECHGDIFSVDETDLRHCICGNSWIPHISQKEDRINPQHYKTGKAKCDCGRTIECIEVTRHMNFNLGNAVKYIWRYEHKGGLEDLKKSCWYINDQIELMERQNDTRKSDTDG